jgi:hypothetical protein
MITTTPNPLLSKEGARGLLPYTSNNLKNQFTEDSMGIVCIVGN